MTCRLSRIRHLCLAMPLLLLASCSGSDAEQTHIGFVEAEWVYVSAPRAGWIVARPVDEGQRVNSGDLLFALDDDAELAAKAEMGSRLAQAEAQARDISTGAREPEIRALEAQLAEARAALALAKVRRDRIGTLAVKGFASKQQRDEAEASYREAQARTNQAEEQIRIARQAGRPATRSAAKAGVEAARASRASAQYDLEQRSIRAAVSGEVSETFLNPGEYATAGSPVLALLPTDGLKVHFFVTQAELPAYRDGTSLKIRADGLKEPVEAKVSFVASDAEFTPPVIYSRDARKKLVFLVKADVSANSGLRPGLPVDVIGP